MSIYVIRRLVPWTIRCVFCNRSESVRGFRTPDRAAYLCQECAEAIALWRKQGLND